MFLFKEPSAQIKNKLPERENQTLKDAKHQKRIVYSVRFHGDVGGALPRLRLLEGSHVVGEVGGGGAVVGGGQSGLPDFVLAVVKQDVGGIRLQQTTNVYK